MEKKDGILMIIIITIVMSILTGAYGILLLLILATVLAVIAKTGVKIYDIGREKSNLLVPVVTGCCFVITILLIIFSKNIWMGIFMVFVMPIFDMSILCKQPKKIINYMKVIIDVIGLVVLVCSIIFATDVVQTDNGSMYGGTMDSEDWFIFCIAIRVLINIIELITGIIKEKKHMYKDYADMDE